MGLIPSGPCGYLPDPGLCDWRGRLLSIDAEHHSITLHRHDGAGQSAFVNGRRNDADPVADLRSRQMLGEEEVRRRETEQAENDRRESHGASYSVEQ